MTDYSAILEYKFPGIGCGYDDKEGIYLWESDDIPKPTLSQLRRYARAAKYIDHQNKLSDKAAFQRDFPTETIVEALLAKEAGLPDQLDAILIEYRKTR